MNARPLSWLKNLQGELNLAKKIPLWGIPPPFPWEDFSRALQTSLSIPDLTIHSPKGHLSSPEEFLLSFGKKPIIKTLELAPLPGMIHLIIASESVEKITKLALSPEGNSKGFTDPELQEGFFQYLLLSVSESFSALSLYPDLQIQWLETKPLPHSSAFCCDFSLTLQGQTFSARLLFSLAFHEAFSGHFANNLYDLFSSPLLDTVDLALKVETGSCLLAKKEWDTIKVGDFLVLDTCSYDPLAKKGTLNLSFAKTPLFKVKIKKDGLKILDYCTYYGDNNMMNDDSDLESPFPDEEDVEFDASKQEPPVKEILSSSLDVPFPIVVEVGQLFMPLKKLLCLEPGNILELSVNPEQGVYLTVHGKKIARGELIKLGEAIGVKIVEIGEHSSS